jgi:NAD(P)-dependent dehydrogenase (short-subunit alcohol dehydrogenase family)
MKNFKNAVAVITGGASGLGLALAREAQARGCHLVIGDIRQDALDSAVAELSAKGEVIGVRTDVSRSADIEALADAAVARFGKVNLLVNNAGIFASSLAWETSEAEYDWVIGVNQRSVCHGIRTFVPRMIAQGDECHVLTISSGAGITVNPGFCTYSMTKHAVLALNEALWMDLRSQGIPNIGVTVAMPGMTQSGIMSPEKTTPDGLQGEVATRMSNPVLKALETMMQAGVAGGLPAEALAKQVFDAIAADKLYTLPAFDDDVNKAVATAIATGRATGENAYPAIVDGFLEALKSDPAA